MARSLLRYLALIQQAAFIFAQNDCVLTVPPNALSAQGLATPYFQTGCDQRQFADQASFVEAAIWDPATNTFSVYHPLVVNKGDVAGKNFIAPVVPTLPANAIVSLSFGTNGNTLTLAGNNLQQANCVNGLPNSIFGQFAYCNSVAFFAAAQAAVANGNLVLPALGNAKDGTPCPTTRDFRIVDMDPNDNVLTSYLLTKNGMLAQNTPANAGNNTGAQTLLNGSDEGLVAGILDPLVGCTPYKVPCITGPTGMCPALVANELLAGANPANPVSLVPMNDPMVVVTNANNGAITMSTQKTNLYRAGVGQPPVSNAATGDAATFCVNFAQGCIYINNNQNLFAGAASPMPAVATNLFTFMGQRWANSFAAAPALGCVNLLGNGNITNPIQLTMNGNCVVTAITINTNMCQMILNGQIGKFTGNTATTAATTAKTMATSAATGKTAATSAATGKTTATSAAAGGTTSAAASASTAATATATRTHHRARPRRGGRVRMVRKSI